MEEKPKRVIEKDWGDGLIYAYAGNIYLLDKENNKIYRYAGNGTSFSAKKDWLAPGIKLDLSDAQNWATDGRIWISYQDGTFSKLSQGSPQNFSPKGVEPPLSSPNFIYTNEDLENVYVLEKEKGRIIVLDENGEYKQQYVSEKIKDASFITASEKENIIIFSSSEGRLYSIKLED